MVYIIIGLILAVIGVFLMRGSIKSADKSLVISITDETNTKNLIENYESLTNSHGEGNFNLYAKLYGKAYANEPIISEYSKKECVYYHIEVDREYEQLETKTDSNGKTTQKWVRKNEVVLDKEHSASDFSIKNSNSSVRVNYSDADIDIPESFSTFEKEANQNGNGFSFAGITFSNTSTIRTIGFRHVERAITVGQQLFVVGNANDSGGELIISRPKEKNKPFIISTKTENEITSDLSSSSKSKKGWGYGLLVVGFALLVFGILKKLEIV
ncbi:MAG: GIDE domain-containing protein [Crocinitomicaceae bacterium]